MEVASTAELKNDGPMSPATASAYDRIRGEIAALDLDDYIGELEIQGFTIIPPDRMMAADERASLLEAVLDWAEKCKGDRPDIQTDDASTFQKSGFGDTMPTVLGAGPPFERLLLHPIVMAFATWLTGYSTTLDYFGPSIKGRGGDALEMHTDAQLIVQAPGPLPAYSVAANCTLALTDFSRENGCTVMVPGSHKRCTWASGPVSREPTAVPVECPAGSLIVWHGNTWHGAFPRTAPGKRVSLLMYFTRHWLRTREDWAERISDEVLARNPTRLATLLGKDLPFGYASYDEFVSKVVRNAKPQTVIGREEAISLWS